jgi:hypothetical protein
MPGHPRVQTRRNTGPRRPVGLVGTEPLRVAGDDYPGVHDVHQAPATTAAPPPRQDVEATISAAIRAIHQALRGGTWIPGQRRRLQQLAPGTWDQALAGVLGSRPGRPDDGPGHAIVKIAIYPDLVWLAARSLREHSASHRAAS